MIRLRDFDIFEEEDVTRRRAWLNTLSYHSTAFVFSEVSLSVWDSERPYVDIGVTVGDCSRQVSLDFSYYANNEREYDNCLNKANILIEELTIIRDEIIKKKKEALAKAEDLKLRESEKDKSKDP